MLAKGSWLHYIALGAKIMPIEWVIVYVVFPIVIACLPE